MICKDITFEDIVKELKQDSRINIFKLTLNLGCSTGLIYRRITAEGYDGLSDLKIDIILGKL